MIETVDREKIAAALAEAMAKTGKRPRLFVEINTGAEPQKAGVAAARTPTASCALCREAYGLEIEGLMCIPARRRTRLAAFRVARRDRQAQRPRRNSRWA